jgi:8-oxo-dGTP diphosphatase
MPNTVPEASRLHVVVAVIKESDRLLIAKRPSSAHQGDLWEFPGGKVEPGESSEQALERELREEVGITVTQYRPLIRIPYDYPERKVLLDVWLITEFEGTAHGAEGQKLRWLNIDELNHYHFPAANGPIIVAARLPEQYLITPEPGSYAEWDDFLEALKRSLDRGLKLVQFRAKTLNERDYNQLAAQVVRVCQQAGAKVLLNSTPEIVHTLNADGIHVNSVELRSLSSRPLPQNMLVGTSCHNLAELEKARAIGCDFAVLGPVRKTATHPEASPLGWRKFSELVECASLPVYALGGVGAEDCMRAWQHGAQGVAAIRALWGPQGELDEATH